MLFVVLVLDVYAANLVLDLTDAAVIIEVVILSISLTPTTLTEGHVTTFARLKTFFLVASYATLHPALSVGRSVGWSVPILLFLYFCGLGFTALAKTL